MFEKHARLLRLIDSAGGIIEGRKKLQKMVYLAQQRGWPFRETFRYHLYGPFSEQLANGIEEMKSYGFVSEERRGQGAAFRYSVTDQGKDLMNKYGNETSPADRDLVADLSKHDSRSLELMATVLFLLKCQCSNEQVFASISNLKPEQNYSHGEVEKAFEFLSANGFLG